ncbi:hypothetical protein GJ496_002997 [Pomphorhynchus laevis]|nr:hypothetical protein GJ496_002997 [Pomphorhynchus laevis]
MVRNSSRGQFGPTIAVFVDFLKAYNGIDRGLLLKKSQFLHKVEGRVLKVLNNILLPNLIRIKDGNQLSMPIRQTRGLLQGDSLSPTPSWQIYLCIFRMEMQQYT